MPEMYAPTHMCPSTLMRASLIQAWKLMRDSLIQAWKLMRDSLIQTWGLMIRPGLLYHLHAHKHTSTHTYL